MWSDFNNVIIIAFFLCYIGQQQTKIRRKRKKNGDGHQTHSMWKRVYWHQYWEWVKSDFLMHLVTAVYTAVYKREGAFGLQPLFSQERFCSKAIAVSITWVAYFSPWALQSVLHKVVIGVWVLCDLCWAFTQTWFNKTLLLLQSTFNGVHNVGYCQWYSWV